jgi:hypothetical protein
MNEIWNDCPHHHNQENILGWVPCHCIPEFSISFHLWNVIHETPTLLFPLKTWQSSFKSRDISCSSTRKFFFPSSELLKQQVSQEPGKQSTSSHVQRSRSPSSLWDLWSLCVCQIKGNESLSTSPEQDWEGFLESPKWQSDRHRDASV